MYYPKSQITPNLYTNGDEFTLSSTGQSYIGYYFKISTGKYFTGRNQDDRPNVELIPLQSSLSPTIPALTNAQTAYSSLVNTFESTNEEYLSLKPQLTKNSFIPYYNPVLPTQQDYQNGEFRRLFYKKTNEILYIEINQEVYSKLEAKDSQILWQLYEPFNLTWQLTGNQEQVAQTNKNIVELESRRKKLPKLGEYLKFDYLKYYK